ncbi:hypothetical protein [Serratia marcescens]|uniref:hypothetical protein n=1 Tax=Serratia marcescens TaxID=615 RepID=UPI0013DC2D37|nr:hypothetical protein [Serratia marcescens]
MQFKDLPESIQEKTVHVIIGAYIENGINVKAVGEIRDAFIALYSEPENAGAYENLKLAAEDTAGSILCKKYSQCGTHVGNAYLVYTDEISDAHKIGEFKSMLVFATKGVGVLDASKYKSGPEHEPNPEETNKMSSVERLLLVNSIANAIISTVKEIQKPVCSHDFEQAIKSVREMCTPGI